ncbi:uncharacterized protein SCHCODRAFT_02608838 [Schizophyllum commune H4-8]|uniref:uncharacterized protein n=1 Tax=Schizophyllum commune (strain H4-8 / FGSC 9210) TaxID=578458 RepID=UPI00215E6453|nr:uncharacterized protein SCHCODRAFT_02608838 [Schizophyllum commune H4-8]KAI5900808.1 hypothetical protein SCHCODRAFT_02608838 [Schizophyllum commune H4-8]
MEDVPRLRSLSLDLGNLSPSVMRFAPMPALTTLRRDVAGAVSELLRPLQQYRQTLITLRVVISHALVEGAAPSELAAPLELAAPSELPVLQRLQLGSDAVRLLQHIPAPALAALQFSGHGADVLLRDYLLRDYLLRDDLRCALDVEHHRVERWPGGVPRRPRRAGDPPLPILPAASDPPLPSYHRSLLPFSFPSPLSFLSVARVHVSSPVFGRVSSLVSGRVSPSLTWNGRVEIPWRNRVRVPWRNRVGMPWR